MHLLSTAKETVLSDFADLETKSTYRHANGETTDFQFNAQKRVFVEVNRKSGLEVMRIKEKPDQVLEVQRVRKLSIDNVYCVGCAKQTVEQIAVGLSSGHIKLYNYKSAQLLHRFHADNTRNTVLYLDYNSTDEHIAAVLESGEINIFGIKTKTKIDTINIDGHSTLARFHPTKRFQLSIASYKGGVSVYDVQAKRKIFSSNEAHSAPCRDLCMCFNNPSKLISVGYDCKVNIFDIRRKAQVADSVISYEHPLSTAALSDCGTYLAVGNLKGEIITYDLRNTNASLAMRKVHDCGVTRIAFVPMPDDAGTNSFSSMANLTSDAVNENIHNAVNPHDGDLRRSVAKNLLNAQQNEMVPSSVATPAATRGQRDSFCDFLDFQSNKIYDRISARSTMRRDSFDWEALSRKPSSDDNRNSIYQTGSGLSSIDGAGNNSVADFSLDGKINVTEKSALLQQTLSGPIRERTSSNLSQQNSGKLDQIDEEHPCQVQNSTNSSLASDKEYHNQTDLEFQTRPRGISSNGRNSTPHQDQRPKSIDVFLKGATNSANLPKSSSTFSSTEGIDLRNELNELRQFVEERFSRMEGELKYVAEVNKWEMYTQCFNLWNDQRENTEEIQKGVQMLLHKDKFVTDFHRLENENRLLKEQMNQLQIKLRQMQEQQQQMQQQHQQQKNS